VAEFLSENVKITTFAPVATGTSTILQTTGLDMTGFDGCLFIVRLGSPATNNTLSIKQAATSGGTYDALLGTSVGAHVSDNPLMVDIKRPIDGFLKYEVARGTTTTIDTICAIQYGARTRPTTQPSGTQIERHHAVAEGSI
jgi:hypothetical protein